MGSTRLNLSFAFVTLLAIQYSCLVTADVLQLPSYSCTQSGNFSHPSKCSAFVSCDESMVAFSIDCPRCDDVERCPDGYLHYNSDLGECDWADIAGCGPRPTTTPDPSECEKGCMQEGDCDCYKTCAPDNTSSTGGRWTEGRCDEGLYWNPNFNSVHGGSCDYWENLDPPTQEEYLYDPLCVTPEVPCKWEADPACDNKYFYLPPNSKNDGEKQHLYCPLSPEGQHLFWNQEALACGTKCSSSPGPCKVC